MRISDWSSDVCSSDLPDRIARRLSGLAARNRRYGDPPAGGASRAAVKLSFQEGGPTMNRTLLGKLAVSGFVIGVTMTGCSMNKMANAPSDYLGKPQTAAKSAHDARDALEAGKVSKAVRLAEQAVAASPRDRKSTSLNSSH